MLRTLRGWLWDSQPWAVRVERRILAPIVRLHRQRLRGTTFIGITGSGGKTTTKDLLAAILSQRGPVTANPASFNTHRGIAKTVFGTRGGHAFCVQELGAGRPGALDRFVWQLAPDVGIVTNIGWDHRSAFRTQEAIAAEKQKLVAALPRDGLAILNADDPRVRDMAQVARCRVLLYGRSADADVRAERIEARWPAPLSFQLSHAGGGHLIRTQLHGAHWVTCVLASLTAGLALGVPIEAAAAALADVHPTPHRLSVYRPGSGPTFLLDDWKAPAWSVPHALEHLGTAQGCRRVAIIGQVSDAPDSRRLYRKLAHQAREHAELVVLVGQWAHYGLRARSDENDASIVAFRTLREADEYLRKELRPDDLVLIKGSRQHHLQRLALAHETRVQCWLDHCAKWIHCEGCDQLARPSKGRQ